MPEYGLWLAQVLGRGGHRMYGTQCVRSWQRCWHSSQRYFGWVGGLCPNMHTLRMLHAQWLGGWLQVLPQAVPNLQVLHLSGLQADMDSNAPHLSGMTLSMALQPLSQLTSLRHVSLQVYASRARAFRELPHFLEALCPQLLSLEVDASECKGGALLDLPWWLSNATALQTLRLLDVKPSTIPPWLGELVSLRCLALRNHGLLMTAAGVPHELAQLTCLRDLDLSGGLLIEVPGAIADMTQLTSLDLSASLDIAHLLNMNNVALFALSLPPTFTRLTALRRLALNNYTRVSGPSLETLAQLAQDPGLSRLELRHCGLHRVPAPLAAAAFAGRADISCNLGTLALSPTGAALSLAQSLWGWVESRLLKRGFSRRPRYTWSPACPGAVAGTPCFKRTFLQRVLDTSACAGAWCAAGWLAAWRCMIASPPLLLSTGVVVPGVASLPYLALERFMDQIRAATIRLAWVWAVQTGMLVGPGAVLSLPMIWSMSGGSGKGLGSHITSKSPRRLGLRFK